MLTRSDHQNGIAYSVVDFADTAHPIERLERSIVEWVDSPELAHLLTLFDQKMTAVGVRARLVQVEQISHDVFDFRKGGERWEAEAVTFDPSVDDAVERLVRRFYREPRATPARELGEVSHALILGARLGTCLLRSELLDNLIRRRLRVGQVWGLGSTRVVTEAEHELAAELGLPPIQTELDAMTVAIAHNFGLGVPTAAIRDRGASQARQLATDPVPITTLAARPDPGETRATTSDTYQSFLELAGTVTAEDHLLIVTSAIHAPFQHVQALGELSLVTGARITSIGAHLGTSQSALVRAKAWTTAEWLQEIRSALWSMRWMYEAVTGN
jgi:hypothetical protein